MKFHYHDYGFNQKENLFLTYTAVRYRFYSTRYPDADNYVYLSKADKQRLLGNPTYRKRLPYLMDAGAILEIDIKENPHNHNQTLKGYIPTEMPYELVQGEAAYIERYMKGSYSSLSFEAKCILETLNHSLVTVTDAQLIEALRQSQIRHHNEDKDYIVRYFNLYKRSIEDFNNNVFLNITEDAFGNRVHSFITTIPKEIRSSYLTINGEPTVELDLHQSQMVILGKIIEKYYGRNSFSEMVKNEDIYIHFGQINNIGRDEAKKLMFRPVFNRNSSKESQMLKNAFPDAYGFIEQFKKMSLNWNPSRKRYSNMAFMLQREESGIFHRVWNNLHNEGISFLPVHDSVIVPQRDLDQTRHIMTSRLNEEIGSHIKITQSK